MVEYIDMTPTWAEILPTWKMIVQDAVKIKKPDQMVRFWEEMHRMAECADKWNALCREEKAKEEGKEEHDDTA